MRIGSFRRDGENEIHVKILHSDSDDRLELSVLVQPLTILTQTCSGRFSKLVNIPNQRIFSVSLKRKEKCFTLASTFNLN